MVDKKLMIDKLVEQESVLFNSRNPEDKKAADTLMKVIADLKSGKYDYKVWED
ncbi:hypothetical protein WKH56_20135 [Priestia sp. SB1]|uniref:hypothetical protein n=1 Tax=Priestia sp. SB1 TaxID=3132359 RepID=UPI00317B10F5